MGLSAALTGGIIMMMLVIVVAMSIPTILGMNSAMSRASSQQKELEDSIVKTSIGISSVQASAQSDSVTLTLENDGLTKLWNYQKFSVIIAYDAEVAPSVSERRTEQLTYAGISNSVPAGYWGIGQFNNDLADPRIVNTGESIDIACTLAYNASSTGTVTATVSTDNGVVASRSVAIA